MFYDVGTSQPSTSKWKNPSNLDVSYSDDGTTIKQTNTSAGICRYWSLIGNNQYWRDANINYCIELEISYINDNGLCGINIGDATEPFGSLNGNKTSDSFNLKLITDGTTVKYYYNGDFVPNQDKTMSQNWGVNLYTYRATQLTFKNIKIYPI